MMSYLPWQQSFDIGNGIAFHVVQFFQRPLRNYPIATIEWKGDRLDGTPSSKKKLLAAIKHMLWGDEDFLRENAKILRNYGVSGNEK
uniref:Uncharacterized protein n=1 Tax=Mycena chlorophos TaxID=658473 RepID=A0ABQ0LI60_MYCCL|nr:predicted protein [Mycena chlorophos]